MSRFFQKFFIYAKLPEMKLFWFFLPIGITLAIINILYLPPFWGFISVGFFMILAFLIAFNSLRLTKSNLEIKVERNELRSIISNLRDGVIAYDPNFRILIFNRAAEAIFSLSSGEIVGQSLTPERAGEPKLKLLIQVIFPSLAPVAIRRSDPDVFPQIVDLSFEEDNIELRATTDKITDPAAQLLGFVKIVHDRTREIELMQSKTEFISVAAHQLRTPLTAIHWALESLMKEPLGEYQKEIANAGLGATIKLLNTVNDLLDVSKIEEGRFGYKFEAADVIPFLEGIITEVSDLYKTSTVKIYFKKPEEASVTLSIDPQKLKIALFNILENAVKYNVQNGEVVVGVRRLKDQPYIEISIKDTGVGIAPAEIDKLFTKFFRGGNVIAAVPDGSGLGLYIAKNVLRRHGGEIRAESELNRGSTFYITLPTDPKLIPPKEIAYGEE